MRYLVVDIGNSTTDIAIVENARVIMAKKVATHAFNKIAILGKFKYIWKNKKPHGIVLSSVVPQRTKFWVNLLEKNFQRKPLIVSHDLQLGFTFKYPALKNAGTDRFADMTGALWQHSPPLIVIDIGTALTIELINKRAEFIGGAIAPGPVVFSYYLSKKTAQLPFINFLRIKKAPSIGRDTISSMQVGLLVGYAGMIENLIKYLIQKNNFSTSTIYVTGGYCSIARKLSFPCIIDKFLTIKGLWRIGCLNHTIEGGN